MYLVLIVAALGSSITLSMILVPDEPYYFFGPLFGLLAALPAFIVVSRLISKKIQPFFDKAQLQSQAGNVPQAIQSFESALAFKNWQLFLEKQVNTQIGILHYANSDEKQAAEYLKDGFPRVSDGHLVLGAILYRQKKYDEARAALENGIRYNKKSPILYNVLAWMLDQQGKKDDAIAVLNGAPKKLKAEEETSDNLERLRNGKKMNMRVFGQFWYMLKFETPPGMGQAKPFRKGFRQPPKAGKQPKAKKGKGKKGKRKR